MAENQATRAGLPRAVGLLGGGVIGGGWAARFLLEGVDVRLYDPDPQAERKVAEMLENARRARRNLTMIPPLREGRLSIVATPEEAVRGAEFVQESAPEREELKRHLLARASRAADGRTVFASSTSGLLPSQLQLDMAYPERLVVGHPFNPVYLLPLVEVCGGKLTSTETIERAEAAYSAVGMSPLRVRREVPGFIANRLLEALWREALWMINDEIATVSEVDDAIRMGPGLRWSIMGTFLIYRIAGGEAGMRHFLAQFGPTLEWPWSRLTDVPDLAGPLLDRIVAQSEAQADGRSIRELERFRDDCLVAVLQGLRSHGAGAGAVLAAHERTLFEVAHHRAMREDDDVSRPLRLHSRRVPAEWVDYNGHVSESRYLQVLADASDAFFRYLGIDSDYLARGSSYFTAETHLSFLDQTHAEDVVEVSTQVLAADDKRLHLYHQLVRPSDGTVLAESESMLLHVDAKRGRVVPAEPQVVARIARVAEAHEKLPRPERAGRRVGDRRP